MSIADITLWGISREYLAGFRNQQEAQRRSDNSIMKQEKAGPAHDAARLTRRTLTLGWRCD
jgi:hypothetical protein